jgi:hypothetical protein
LKEIAFPQAKIGGGLKDWANAISSLDFCVTLKKHLTRVWICEIPWTHIWNWLKSQSDKISPEKQSKFIIKP